MKKKLTEVIKDIYRELYANATPPGDFDKIVEEAEVVDGLKQIPYMDYEIDGELLEGIMRKHCLINKLSKSCRDAVRFEVLLGCSPKTKSKET